MSYIDKFKDPVDAQAAMMRFALVFTKVNISDEDLQDYFGVESGFEQAHAEVNSILDDAINLIDRTVEERKKVRATLAAIEEQIRKAGNAQWN